jgi:hypothetical protein
MIVIEERFADVEISDTDIDQIDVVGDLIRHCEMESERRQSATCRSSDARCLATPLRQPAMPP